MKRTVLALAAALALGAPAFAEGLSMDTPLGTTMDEVKASLVAMGYEVRKSEIEDGLIEVYFVGNGEMGEVYVDGETGLPVRIKLKS